ncbi:hypothetical protein BGZ54_000243 [Gamsiella multidivaricata]|nr:hypothetical protein BGZ54_000243 [Gamsiella multidivaricata]
MITKMAITILGTTNIQSTSRDVAVAGLLGRHGISELSDLESKEAFPWLLKTWICKNSNFKIFLGKAALGHLDDEEEMLTEVAAYKALEDIQGDSIPRFKIGGYYGGIFSIATEVAGSPLEVDKLSQEERWKIVDKLSLIHMHGVLHNDIRPENILVRHGGNGI